MKITELIKNKYKSIIPEFQRIQFRLIIWKILSILYRGNKVTCNCCLKNFKYFLPYGDFQKRENAICPYCRSLERTRMLWDFLLKSNLLTNNANVLDIAPFKIIEKNLKKKKNIKYKSGDLNPILCMETIDISKIKYIDNTFDVIICGHVLYLLQDDILALNEFYRTLKKGGCLIIYEHIFNELETTIEIPSDLTIDEIFKISKNPEHKRFYGKDFAKRLASVGFEITEYDHTLTLTENQLIRYGMKNCGLLHLCFK